MEQNNTDTQNLVKLLKGFIQKFLLWVVLPLTVIYFAYMISRPESFTPTSEFKRDVIPLGGPLKITLVPLYKDIIQILYFPESYDTNYVLLVSGDGGKNWTYNEAATFERKKSITDPQQSFIYVSSDGNITNKLFYLIDELTLSNILNKAQEQKANKLLSTEKVSFLPSPGLKPADEGNPVAEQKP